VWYLDASAFLKLVVHEPESEAMRAWAAAHPPAGSSHLLLTEALRAARRLEIDRGAVLDVLGGVTLIAPSASTFFVAGELAPAGLRSLDALHLAAALELGPDLSGLVTYDLRLADAAAVAGVTVVRPEP
jgi:predicted nucleic acid-binding protein